MSTGDNAIQPLFEPGRRITAAATAAITGGRFVTVGAAFQGGPLLDVSTPTGPLTKGNLMQVVTCGAGAKAVGVAEYDASAADEVLAVLNGPGMVVPVTAGGTVTFGQEVESDSTGRAITLASGRSNGIAISSATVGNPVYVRLHT